MKDMTPVQEKLAVIAELAKHIMALVLIVGFLGLTYIVVLGFVDLTEPVVAGFVGTVLGAVGAKVEPPISNYFSTRPPRN